MACGWCSVHEVVDDLLLQIRELGSEMDKRGGSKTSMVALLAWRGLTNVKGYSG